jgi:hypothetical protein
MPQVAVVAQAGVQAAPQVRLEVSPMWSHPSSDCSNRHDHLQDLGGQTSLLRERLKKSTRVETNTR